MGLLGLYMGKVAQVRKYLVSCALFLKLVRPLIFSDPACAENRVCYTFSFQVKIKLNTKNPTKRCLGIQLGLRQMQVTNKVV